MAFYLSPKLSFRAEEALNPVLIFLCLDENTLPFPCRKSLLGRLGFGNLILKIIFFKGLLRQVSIYLNYICLLGQCFVLRGL
ncbi:hypothetical protein, partial [Nostoc flagelliforme]|uniref:hypothetical protein n=1 Tax=Nostoc flagelliforme TaxID=1306274 RepID=UPI0030DC2B2F